MKNQCFSIATNAFVFCLIGVVSQPSIAQEEPKAPPVVNIPGTGGDQIKVALLSLLSYSYYLTGQFNFAQQYAEQTVAQYKSLAVPYKREGLEAQVDRANTILKWIEIWEKGPIATEPQTLKFTLESQTTVAQQQLSVRTLRSTSLTATSNNPAVKVRFLNQEQKRDYYFEKSIIVEVVPEAVVTNTDAMVEISNPQLPDFRFSIPVSVQAPTQISHPALVSFGIVKSGQTEVRVFKLTSSTPFRITKLDFRDGSKTLNNEALQSTLDAGKSATEHRVELKYSPATSGQSYNGKIRILTDSYSQEVIEIPFVAQAQ